MHYLCPSASNEGGHSPYRVCEGRHPDMRQMCVHTWGCPVGYIPHGQAMNAPSNKNSQIAVWGHFVGIKWPMVLVLRSEDKKVVSVSRKKLKFYEGIYCLPPHINPVTSKMVSIESADQGEYDAEFVPKTVQSVKQSHLLDFSKQVSKKAQRKQAAAVANELEDTHLTAIDQGEGTLEGPSKFQEENIEIETLRDQPLIDAVAEEAAATRIEPQRKF